MARIQVVDKYENDRLNTKVLVLLNIPLKTSCRSAFDWNVKSSINKSLLN